MPSSSPRVLFYSHDTYGLGHIRRTLAIGEAVLDRVPGRRRWCSPAHRRSERCDWRPASTT